MGYLFWVDKKFRWIQTIWGEVEEEVEVEVVFISIMESRVNSCFIHIKNNHIGVYRYKLIKYYAIVDREFFILVIVFH